MKTRSLAVALVLATSFVLGFVRPAQAYHATLPMVSNGNSWGTASSGGGFAGIDEECVGTLPMSSGGNGANSGGNAGGTQGKSKPHKVKPGETHTNEDGATVSNSEDSEGNAFIDPKNGGGSSSTTITTKTGFEGSIDGIDANDTVKPGSSNTGTINGNGGTVQLSGNSTWTINNGTGGGNMTVTTPAGNSVTIPPGTNGVVFNT